MAWIRIELGGNLPFSRGGCVDADTCRLVFCLAGALQLSGHEAHACSGLRLGAGCCGMAGHPRHCRCRASAVADQTRVVEIRFSRMDLARLLGSEGPFDDVLGALFAAGPLSAGIKTTPAMDGILRRVEAADAGADALFMLAKALELIWLFSKALHRVACSRASGGDLRAVARAQAILENNLVAPPSLKVLAGQVGMSLSKLKLVFPKVCGHPPYAYLRHLRMERAMDLVRCSEKSVTEIAYDVGYSSLSRFSCAFARRFGLNPSEVRRKR